MQDIPDYNIKKGVRWNSSENTTIIRYGATIKFYNAEHKLYLVATRNKYHHSGAGSNEGQVMAYSSSSGDQWHIESTSNSNENQPIHNGETVLHHPLNHRSQ